MNIEEAIRSNQAVYVELRSNDRIAFAKGIQLGIEAMKEVNALRKVLAGLGKSILPGETED